MSGRAPLAVVTVEERRALRGSYRQLAAETLAGKENLVVNGGAGLQALLQKVDALHSQAVRPREHAVDAEVFAQLAHCGLQMVMQGAAANEGRRPADLVRAVRAHFASEPGLGSYAGDEPGLDWAGLGGSVSSLFKGAPGLGCMFGPLAAQAKVRKAIVRQPKRAAPEAVTRPNEVEQVQEGERQETDRNYTDMWRVLKEDVGFGQAVPLINLVCSHASFVHTVENIFTLSFLVRDQRVQLLGCAASGVAVSPVSDEARASAQQRGAGGPQQFMMSFTMRDWEVMKQLVEPQECVMPDRSHHHDNSSGGAAAAAAGQQPQASKRARRG